MKSTIKKQTATKQVLVEVANNVFEQSGYYDLFIKYVVILDTVNEIPQAQKLFPMASDKAKAMQEIINEYEECGIIEPEKMCPFFYFLNRVLRIILQLANDGAQSKNIIPLIRCQSQIVLYAHYIGFVLFILSKQNEFFYILDLRQYCHHLSIAV